MSAPSLHATCVLVGPDGVLIRGSSGAGKTRLAWALLAWAEARGRFARFVADDRVLVEARHGRLLARAPAALAGIAERRGVGLVPVPTERAAVLALAVDIEPGASRMPTPAERRTTLRGVSLARLAVPPDPSLSVGLVLAALRPGGLSGDGADEDWG